MELGLAPPCTATVLGKDLLIYPLYFPFTAHLIFSLKEGCWRQG